MSLLSPPTEPSNKYKALTYTGVALAVALAAVLYFTFRYYPEKKAAEHFLGALVAGDTKQAYQLWKPQPTYKMEDFLADWSPTGYYGPVKSYKIIREDSPHGSNAVQVAVAISQYSPMPSPDDPAQVDQAHKTRVIAVWVVSKDHSFTFPP